MKEIKKLIDQIKEERRKMLVAPNPFLPIKKAVAHPKNATDLVKTTYKLATS